MAQAAVASVCCSEKYGCQPPQQQNHPRVASQDLAEPLSHVISELLASDDLDELPLYGKRVLLRADLNVPVEGDIVTDASRIAAVLPTIQMLQGKGARVIIASHFGRPSPKKQSWEEMKASNSLQLVAEYLRQQLGASFVGLAPDCIGDAVAAMVHALQPGQACLLENTRFHAAETSNDDTFAAELGKLADVFVNDAFGVCHRDQASVTAITRHVPASCPGPLVRHELKFLGEAMASPRRPLCVIMGGAKVADKIGVLWAMIDKADIVAVGGRMAFTFLAAQGVCVGETQVEGSWLHPALEMIQYAKAKGVQLLLPQDVLVSSSLEEARDARAIQVSLGCCTAESPCIPAGCYGVDIGPATAAAYAQAIRSSSTVFWNGPMGKFEVPAFSSGTLEVAKAMAAAGAAGAVTVVGGGDSVAAVNQLGLGTSMSHLSTGGGASLELVEGRGMPGLRALVDSRRGRGGI